MDRCSDDPRVRDTQTRLIESLLELTIERGYGRTRIKDILERASVARSTFYAHFDDKDDLFVGGFDLFRVRPIEVADPEGPLPLPDVTRPLSHAALFRDLYQSLKASGELDLPLGKMRRDLVAGYEDVFADLATRGFTLSGDPKLLARFVAGAFVAVVVDWLERGARETPSAVAASLEDLIRRAATG